MKRTSIMVPKYLYDNYRRVMLYQDKNPNHEVQKLLKKEAEKLAKKHGLKLKGEEE